MTVECRRKVCKKRIIARMELRLILERERSILPKAGQKTPPGRSGVVNFRFVLPAGLEPATQ